MADGDGTTEVGSARGYRVLARKYRPRSFDDLIGQDAMVRTLSNAFETGRIPQAWMLTGVRGVGKTTTARILARALNYERPGAEAKPTIHMPELGVHCQAIIEGRHVDVLEMDAASHTGIDDVRALTDGARYSPVSARYKVYIIDEVHMLSEKAFNAFLKTLEEPPPHVKFVFATTEIRKVPVTVLSRCQRFDLRRIAFEDLTRLLTKVTTAEGIEAAPEALALVARAGEGSARDSLSLLDQAIAHGGGAVSVETVRDMLGLVDRLRVFDLFEHVMKGDAKAALEAFDAQYRDGAEPQTVIAELAEIVHAVTRAKVAGLEAASVGLPEAETRRVGDLSSRLALRVLARAWQLLMKGLPEVQSAPRPVAAAEMLLVRLCHAADLPTPDEALRALAEAGSAPAGAPRGGGGGSGGGGGASAALAAREPAPRPLPRVVAEQAAVPATAPAARAEPAVRLARFEDLVGLVAAKRDIPLKIALERSVHLVRYQHGRIDLRLAPSAPATLVADLQKRLLEWTSERWMVVVTQEEGEETLHSKREAQQRTLLDDVRSDPTVSAILARFPGAQIVDVRVREEKSETVEEAAPPPDPDMIDEDF
jgi:DNA polymerase-3 subunit gamma/tau